MNRLHEVPSPDSVPPVNPDPQPGDDKPKAPPPPEGDRTPPPVELPGRPHEPERVDG